MKTKKKLIYALIVMAIVTVACKKLSESPIAILKPTTKKVDLSKMKHVKPKLFDIQPKEAASVVKHFKSHVNQTPNQTARIVEADSISLDSAVWVIEATMNYDFDMPLTGGFETWRSDTIIVSIPINIPNQMVSSDDIEDAYNTLHGYVADSAGSNFAIKVIDIEAYQPDPSVDNYVLAGVIKKYGTSYPVTCPSSGGPFTSTNLYKISTNSQWNAIGGFCSGGASVNNPYSEAVTALNVYQNCQSVSHFCDNAPSFVGFYYGVYGTLTPFCASDGANGDCANNPFAGILHCTDYETYNTVPSPWWCSNSNSCITGSQLNTYLANQISFANGYPLSGYETLWRYVDCNLQFKNIYVASYGILTGFAIFWKMDCTWAKFSCYGRLA